MTIIKSGFFALKWKVIFDFAYSDDTKSIDQAAVFMGIIYLTEWNRAKHHFYLIFVDASEQFYWGESQHHPVKRMKRSIGRPAAHFDWFFCKGAFNVFCKQKMLGREIIFKKMKLLFLPLGQLWRIFEMIFYFAWLAFSDHLPILDKSWISFLWHFVLIEFNSNHFVPVRTWNPKRSFILAC